MITAIFLFSIFAVFSVFFLNPLFCVLAYLIKPPKKNKLQPFSSSVSLIIVVHNGEQLIAEKLDNSLSLDFGGDDYEIIVVSDGSYDATNEIVQGYGESIRFIKNDEHLGKHIGLNKAAEAANGEILVFSDADAILSKESIPNLLRHFFDPTTGGVSGRRIISDRGGESLKDAQSAYIGFDTAIKKLESLRGSISSNDGKLYAIRKSLFRPVPSSVTDDLFVHLTVVSLGFRFTYEHHAVALIKTPSRDPAHEIVRRKRIVTTSLRGISMYKELLNPSKFGMFSVSLFINKILRRTLPVFLITLFISSFLLVREHLYYSIFFVLQAAFYASNIFYLLVLSKIKKIKLITRIFSVAFYFTLGNYGTLLGLTDFLRGKKVEKWVPVKNG
ncbi:MAG: glycosyltransferase [Nitrospirae bacterium YQR-1]